MSAWIYPFVSSVLVLFRIRTLWIMISFLDTRERRKIMARDLHYISTRCERVTLNFLAYTSLHVPTRVRVAKRVILRIRCFRSISSWSKRPARLTTTSETTKSPLFFFFFFSFSFFFFFFSFPPFLQRVQYLYNIISSRFSCRTEFLIWNTRRYLE